MLVASLLLVHGKNKYSSALGNLKSLFRTQMPDVMHKIIVADNSLQSNVRRTLSDGVLLIGAPNDVWVWSAWSHAMRFCSPELENCDLINFTTSAFKNTPNDYLVHFNTACLNFALDRQCVLGHVDGATSSYSICGYSSSHWMRSGIFFLPPKVLNSLGDIMSIASGQGIFSGNVRKPFLPNCGISPEFQRVLLHWLCAWPGEGDLWHECFELTRDTYPLFAGKTLDILNEQMLSRRLVAQGTRIADVTWLNMALASGSVPTEIPHWKKQKTEIAVFKKVIRLEGGATKKRKQQSGPRNYEIIKLPEKARAIFARPGQRMLAIDHYVPRPDMDAGSSSVFNMLKIYNELGYSVDFLPHDLAYSPGYSEDLEGIGCRILCRNNVGSFRRFFAKHGNEYDIVFLTRAHVAQEFLPLIKEYAPQAKILYDTCDLHYLRMRRKGILNNDAAMLSEAEKVRKVELGIISSCDMNLLVSAYEYELLKQEGLNQKVRYVPIIFTKTAKNIPGWAERSGIVFLGGYDHLPNVDAVLYFYKHIFPMIRKAIPGIKFHIAGSKPPERICALADDPDVVVHGFLPELEPLFSRIRLMVVPLRYGAGIKGKIASGISFGLPVISTSIGAESMPHGEGSGVIKVDAPQKFAATVISLYNDREAWERESAGALLSCQREYSKEIGKLRQIELLKATDSGARLLETWRLRSEDDYKRYRAVVGQRIGERQAYEASLAASGCENFTVPGYCAVCGKETDFQVYTRGLSRNVDGSWKGINWREHCVCPSCHLNNRMRASIHYFYQFLRPKRYSLVYLTEQATSLYRIMKDRQPFLAGSEYLGPDKKAGSYINGVRHEDMTALSWPDNSFDFVLSFDVLEHVGNDIVAFEEIFRILKSGGTFLFTAPFSANFAKKLVRAEIGPDGKIIHHLPPEIHGNPIDPTGGSLAFRCFGWDMLTDLRNVGFADAYAEAHWSDSYAYLGGEQFLFVATKAQRYPEA